MKGDEKMGHLRKKIQKYFNNLYCEYVPIINQNCLMFYKYQDGKQKFLFYYLYDQTKNLKYNLNEIDKLYKKYGNLKFVKFCKYGKQYFDNECYILSEDYNCRNCFYSVFCKKEGEE